MLEQDDADLEEYAAGLCLDVRADSDLHWIIAEAFNAPLPASWSEHIDDEGRIYFFSAASGESSWEHPMDAVYRELISIVKQVQLENSSGDSDVCARLIHNHLREVHQRALEALEGWSGPYVSEEGEYFYNESLKVSVWESPLAAWNPELILRHSVLCRCLLPDHTSVGADGSIERFEPVGAPQVTNLVDLLQKFQLPPLELLRRAESDGSDAPRTPSTSRDYFTARSGCSTTRSHLSSTRSGGERHISSYGAATIGGTHSSAGTSKRSPKKAPKPPQPQAPITWQLVS